MCIRINSEAHVGQRNSKNLTKIITINNNTKTKSPYIYGYNNIFVYLLHLLHLFHLCKEYFSIKKGKFLLFADNRLGYLLFVRNGNYEARKVPFHT